MKNKLITITLALFLILVSFAPVLAIQQGRQNTNPVKPFQEAEENNNSFKSDAYQDFKNKIGVWKNLSQDQQEKHLGDAKNYLLKTIERIIAYLNKVQAKIKEMERFGEEGQEAVLNQLEEQIGWFEAKKQEIESMESLEDFKNVSQELRQYWYKAKLQIRRALSNGFQYRFNAVFAKMEQIQNKIENQIQIKQEEAKDTSRAEELMNQFKEKFAEAKETYSQAQEKFSNANQGEDFQAQYQEGQSLLKQAHQQLKQAHQLLKQVIEELKVLN
jgi:chromosome segregation ATPase